MYDSSTIIPPFLPYICLNIAFNGGWLVGYIQKTKKTGDSKEESLGAFWNELIHFFYEFTHGL